MLSQRRRDHVVDQRGGAAQGSRPGAEDGGAAGLEHLRGDVDRHVGPRLEDRADHPDGHAPLEHALAGGQVADETLLGRLGGVGEHLELDGHVGEALGREPQAVEEAAGHAAGSCGVDVGVIGGEQRVGLAAQPTGGGAQGGVDGSAPGGTDARRGRGGSLRGGAHGDVLGGVGAAGDGAGAHAARFPRRPAGPRSRLVERKRRWQR